MLATGRHYDGYYQRAGRAMNVLLHDQLLSDSYGSPYSSKRDTTELESRTGVTHRKRVPVACERCRKRKIKCSGDSGDGTGCDHCKSAGSEDCQFLRVRSRIIDLGHPIVSNSRPWQNQNHYHPYSRNRNSQYTSTSQSYLPQSNMAYSGWPNSLEFAGIPGSTHAPWTSGSYTSSHPVYEAEGANNFVIHTPSYMLPNPDHGTRSGMTYEYSTSRSNPGPFWLDCYNTDNSSQQVTQISPIYPLTPVESHKSYSVYGGLAGQHPLSNERTDRSDAPSIATGLPPATGPGRDTPPLSAVSHRSSHTWNTDISSHISNVSSRTSCGSNQDLPTAQLLTTCEDQAAIYPYPAESTSPHVNISASALPIATALSEQEHMSGALTPTTTAELAFLDTSALSVRGRRSRDSLRTASPANTLYGYPSTTNRISRRSHGLYPGKLLTSGFPTTWRPSPAASRNNSLVAHSTGDGADYVDERESPQSAVDDTATF